MANEGLEYLLQGPEEWHAWVKERQNTGYRQIQFEDVAIVDKDLMHYDFTECNFKNSDFSHSRFLWCGFTNTVFNNVNINNAVFFKCKSRLLTIENCSLQKIRIDECNFHLCRLAESNAKNSSIHRCTFLMCILETLNVSSALFGSNSLAMTRISMTTGLEDLLHDAMSSIDFHTIQKSENLPIKFLRGIGLPETYIEYLPSFLATAFDYGSCFISYSEKDETFARKLYDDLQNSGVRCWFAPRDMKGGQKIHKQIYDAIQMHDKLLLILSENSISSNWVHTEIKRAKKREREEGRQMLFPILVTDFNHIKNWELFDADSGIDLASEIREYYLPSFVGWQDEEQYQKELTRLIDSLKST